MVYYPHRALLSRRTRTLITTPSDSHPVLVPTAAPRRHRTRVTSCSLLPRRRRARVTSCSTTAAPRRRSAPPHVLPELRRAAAAARAAVPCCQPNTDMRVRYSRKARGTPRTPVPFTAPDDLAVCSSASIIYHDHGCNSSHVIHRDCTPWLSLRYHQHVERYKILNIIIIHGGVSSCG
jgi:hypothetical protein